MEQKGSILESSSDNGIATITFGHEKSNSLPRLLLYSIADEILKAGNNPDIKVVVLKSIGEKSFCAGASFDELLEVKSLEAARGFFSGFARILLAMKQCPKFIVTRVQGKTAGGGAGIICASDYCFAHTQASVRLSELAIGIGPFTIGPAVQRKIGLSAFSEMSISADWRDAQWCKAKGMYVDVFDTIEDLDTAVSAFAQKLSAYSPQAMLSLKKVLWEGTDGWEELLDRRVGTVSSLVISQFAQDAIQKAKQGSR